MVPVLTLVISLVALIVDGTVAVEAAAAPPIAFSCPIPFDACFSISQVSYSAKQLLPQATAVQWATAFNQQ